MDARIGTPTRLGQRHPVEFLPLLQATELDQVGRLRAGDIDVEDRGGKRQLRLRGVKIERRGAERQRTRRAGARR